MAHEAFISYSAHDKATADAVCKKLEDAGIDCWMAPRDIRPGDTWGGAIVQAIDGSRVMVIVFSSHSNESPQVLREIERAVRKQLTIIPFRIDAIEPSSDMDYFLAATHWLDAYGADLDAHLGDLHQVVRSFLERGVQPPLRVGDRTPTPPPAGTGTTVQIQLPDWKPPHVEWSRFHPRSWLPPVRERLAGIDRRWWVAGFAALAVAGSIAAAVRWWPEPREAPAPRASVRSERAPVPEPAPPPVVELDPLQAVAVPGGEFFLGCGGDGVDCAKLGQPGGQMVYAEAFQLDKHEVSVEEYAACVTAGACSPPGTGRFCNWNAGDRLDHPVNCVTFAQAEAFCSFRGWRLPREAEWEKAARGTDRRVFAWGNDPATCDHAVINVRGDCGAPGTQPVDARPQGASAFGALGLAGNVQEWTGDWYDVRRGRRAVRGGNWNSYPAAARVWRRDPVAPKKASPTVGFRCARDAG